MGAYNILKVDFSCLNCKHVYTLRLQFKFGDTWQYEYEIGDIIKWGGNDIGSANIKVAQVYGIAENSVCPFCGYNNLNEYDITMSHSRISNVAYLDNIDKYQEDPEGNFYIND